MSSVLTVRVPEDVQHELGDLSEKTGRSRSWLAAEAIKEYLERERWQVTKILEGVADADSGDFASSDEVAETFGRWTSRAS